MNNNKRKKGLIFVVLFSSLILVGCGNRTIQSETVNETIDAEEEVLDMSKYKKDVDNYTLKTSDNKGSVSFSLAKDLNYSGSSKTDTIRLVSSVNNSSILIKVFHTNKTDKEINKSEGDFVRKSYYNYSKVGIDKLNGWQVFEKRESNINYEAGFIILEEDGLVYGITIKVYSDDLDEGFNAEDIIKSTDYKYLLHSIKVIEDNNQ